MSETLRIDKWLWAARFFKTRTLAAGAVSNGKVRSNGERVKVAHGVRIGDILDINNGATIWQVCVRGLSESRGAAPVAQTLYEETAQSVAKRQSLLEQNKHYREPGSTIKGRPTKKDRREIDNLN